MFKSGYRKKRKMRNPDLWIGRRIPHDMDANHLWDFSTCDNCGGFYRADDLHALLWPESAADWLLQELVGVEEAQGFCPDCLEAIQEEADEIDSEWRERHGI